MIQVKAVLIQGSSTGYNIVWQHKQIFSQYYLVLYCLPKKYVQYGTILSNKNSFAGSNLYSMALYCLMRKVWQGQNWPRQAATEPLHITNAYYIA